MEGIAIMDIKQELAGALQEFQEFLEYLKANIKRADITIPEDIAKELVPISMKIGESMKIYGFRFFLNTKTMLKALALMKEKNTVSREELNEFLELSKFFNSDFNPI